jgi:hypothetical protein
MRPMDKSLLEQNWSPTNPRRVSDKDKFRLAKTILLLSFVLYVVIALIYLFAEHLMIAGPARQVWSFSSQGLFGIVNLIIGFYFGGKVSKK